MQAGVDERPGVIEANEWPVPKLAAGELLVREAVDVITLVTDRLALAAVARGFQLMRDAASSLKILFRP